MTSSCDQSSIVGMTMKKNDEKDSNPRPLLLAVSARALFDLSAETRVLDNKGLDAYRAVQRKKRNTLLKKGVAFAFVERMLALNSIKGEGRPLVEVMVVSRMDAQVGMRVNRSIEEYGLEVGATVFTGGGDVTKYLKAMGVRLYLSRDEDSVRSALGVGVPSGHIVTDNAIVEHTDIVDGEIRLSFDFDGILGDTTSEAVFQKGGLPAFNENEKKNSTTPLNPGPLLPFVESLIEIQQTEHDYMAEYSDYRQRLYVSIVTARGIPSDERVMNTVEQWGLSVDDAFFLCGHDKTPILEALHPHLFLDDQWRHVSKAKDIAPAVHVPFGVMNEKG